MNSAQGKITNDEHDRPDDLNEYLEKLVRRKTALEKLYDHLSNVGKLNEDKFKSRSK